MWKKINLENCLAHINRQSELIGSATSPHRPAMTISRMCGAGGRTVASKLVDYLQPRAPLGCQWTIFDRQLIEKVLADNSISVRLADMVRESSQSVVAEVLNKFRGQPVASSEIARKTIETIWRLAEGGYVILIGRGANIITAKLENVFHVRLVGSLEKRIQRVEEVYDMDRRTAESFIKSQDASKRSYLKEYFGQDIDNAQLYHLVINTDRISYENTARLIAETFFNWSKTLASPSVTAK